MHEQVGDLDRVLTDFVGRYARDVARDGDPAPLADYLARYPGFEGPIEAEYHALQEIDRDETACGSAFDTEDFDDAVGATLLTVRPGDRIGRYLVRRRVGRGGQGAVFEARDEQLDRNVAIKMIVGLGMLSTEALARFEREGRLAARIEHPNVCRVYEVGVERGVPYIVMQLADGETLARRLDRRRQAVERGEPDPEPLDAVLQLVERVARGVAAAHEPKVVHRDLKPGNIIVQAEDEPIILDFGLARDAADGDPTLTRSGRSGTPAYMAPEQYALPSSELDHRVDLFALGVILFECATLSLPFDRELMATTAEVQSARPPNVAKARTGLPRGLQTIIDAALEPDREARYQSAAAFADDVARVRDGGMPSVRPVRRVVRWWASIRRRPVRAAIWAGALAAAVVVAVLIFDVFAERRRERRANEREHYRKTMQSIGLSSRDRSRTVASRSALSTAGASGTFEGGLMRRRFRAWIPTDPLPGPVASVVRSGDHALGVLRDGRVFQLGEKHVSIGAFPFGRIEQAAACGDALVVAGAFDDGRHAVGFRLTAVGAASTIGVDAPLVGLDVARDGRVVALATKERVHLWDPASDGAPVPLAAPTFDAAHSVAVSPDGRWIAIGASVTRVQPGLIVIDRTGTHAPDVRLCPSAPKVIRFTADSTRIVALLGTGSVASYCARPDREAPPNRALEGVVSLALGGNGHRILVGTKDGVVHQLDRRLQVLDRFCRDEGTFPPRLGWSTAHGVLFAVSGTAVHAWDLDRCDERTDYRITGATAFTFLGAGRLLVVGENESRHEIDVATARRRVTRFDRPVHLVSGVADVHLTWNQSVDDGLVQRSDDGRVTIEGMRGSLGAVDYPAAAVVVQDPDDARRCRIKVWDGERILHIGCGEIERDRIRHLDVCARGFVLVRGEETLWCARFADSTLRPLGEASMLSPSDIATTAISRDGRRVAIGFADGRIEIRDVDGGEPVRFAVEQAPTCIAFAPRGDYVAVAIEECVELYRFGFGSVLKLSAPPDSQRIAFSPSGERLALLHEAGVTVWSTDAARRDFPGEVEPRRRLARVLARVGSFRDLVGAIRVIPDALGHRVVRLVQARLRGARGEIPACFSAPFMPPAWYERELLLRQLMGRGAFYVERWREAWLLYRLGRWDEADACAKLAVELAGPIRETLDRRYALMRTLFRERRAGVSEGVRLDIELETALAAPAAYLGLCDATRTVSFEEAARRLARETPGISEHLPSFRNLLYGKPGRIRGFAWWDACDASIEPTDARLAIDILAGLSSRTVDDDALEALLRCRAGDYRRARSAAVEIRRTPKVKPVNRAFAYAIEALCDLGDGRDPLVPLSRLATCPALEHHLLLALLRHQILRAWKQRG